MNAEIKRCPQCGTGWSGENTPDYCPECGHVILRRNPVAWHGTYDCEPKPPAKDSGATSDAEKVIRLLVTFNGEEASVSVDQVIVEHTGLTIYPVITHAYNVVSGRSMGDVVRCIEAAALKSQGRVEKPLPD